MSWSLLSRYIVSCPASNPYIDFQVFPALSVTNDPNLLVDGYLANITHNRTSLSEPGRTVTLSWENPGMSVSYNNSYTTSIGGNIATSSPKYVAWISQLNTTYTPLTITGDNTGSTTQPGGVVFPETPDNGIVNQTMFVGLSDSDIYVTPYNLSLLNDHLFAFGLYQSN